MVGRRGETVYVNVAAGRYPMSGFINLDNSPFLWMLPAFAAIKPFLREKHRKIFEEYARAVEGQDYLRHNCMKPLPFRDHSIHHILCSHFLEHVYPEEALAILRGFRDKLVAGGTIHIVVPCLRHLVTAYLSSSQSDAANEFVAGTLLSQASRPKWRYRLMELSGAFGLQHRWMYDRMTISHMIHEAGFTELTQNSTPSRNWRSERNPWEIEVVARLD